MARVLGETQLADALDEAFRETLQAELPVALRTPHDFTFVQPPLSHRPRLKVAVQWFSRRTARPSRARSTRSRRLSGFVVSSTAGGDRVNRLTRKRIAHILPFPSVGGTEHATLRIAQAIDPCRFTSVAFCLPKAAPVQALVSDCGIPCTTSEPPVPSYRHGAAFFARRSVLRGNCGVATSTSSTARADGGAPGGAGGTTRRPADALPYTQSIRRHLPQGWRFSLAGPQVRVFSRDTWRHFAYNVSPERGTVVYDGIVCPPTATKRRTTSASARSSAFRSRPRSSA